MMNSRPRFAPLRVLALLVFLPVLCAAQEGARAYEIGYRLSMPEPESHLFHVSIEVRGAGAGAEVDFQMPRWSPGRYAVFDFAKNVQEVRAWGACPPQTKCKPAPVRAERLDTQTWRVRAPGEHGVVLSYKVFADDLSGTFSQLDRRHANYNGASVFMYVAGHKPDPVRLKIDAPAGWKIVNGLTAREGHDEFQFPNYDLLIDTPTEIAPDWTVDEFKVAGKTIRVVVHSFGDEGGLRPELVRQVERIVRAQFDMMGVPDFERYVFLIHFDPTARRSDGMEHLNSTQIVGTRQLAQQGALSGAVGTASHEFFHVWNVKRLRPAGLGPWDFTRPVVTRGLWIAEGLTNYYGTMHEHRAGLLEEGEVYQHFSGTITGVEDSPGNRLMSAEESSIAAAFLDRSTHDQQTNLANSSISYYQKGETLGLVLDLLIRGRTKGRSSLDEVMRRAYRKFYLESPNDSYYLKGRAYTPEEFFALANEVTGLDLSFFLDRHVRGVEPPPYEEAFAHAGLRFVREPLPGSSAAGLYFDSRDPAQATVVYVQPGSPADRAGLRAGDVLLTVARKEVTGKNWRELLDAVKADDPAPLTARRAGQSVNATLLIPSAPARFNYRIVKDDKATPEARALREAWLKGSRQ